MTPPNEDAVPHPHIVAETASNWLTKSVHGLVVKHLQHFKHDEKLLDNYRRMTLASQSPDNFYLRLELFNGGGFELLAVPAPGKGEELTPGLRRWFWVPENVVSPELSLLAVEYRTIVVKYIQNIYSKCFAKDKIKRINPYPYVRVGRPIVMRDEMLENIILTELMCDASSIKFEMSTLHLKINHRQFQTGMVPKTTGKNAANFKCRS